MMIHFNIILLRFASRTGYCDIYTSASGLDGSLAKNFEAPSISIRNFDTFVFPLAPVLFQRIFLSYALRCIDVFQ